MHGTYGLEVVDVELDVEGSGHGDEVKHGVSGASESHDGDDRVLERSTGDDVLRLKVLRQRQHTRTCTARRNRRYEAPCD